MKIKKRENSINRNKVSVFILRRQSFSNNTQKKEHQEFPTHFIILNFKSFVIYKINPFFNTLSLAPFFCSEMIKKGWWYWLLKWNWEFWDRSEIWPLNVDFKCDFMFFFFINKTGYLVIVFNRFILKQGQ